MKSESYETFTEPYGGHCRSSRFDRFAVGHVPQRIPRPSPSGSQPAQPAHSLSAAGVERLTLTNREFRRHAEELERTVEDLQLKVRRLQSASRTAVTTAYPVEARLCDTVIVRDTLAVADTLSRLHYVNPWVTLDGVVAGDLFRGRIESRDTLIQVVHRIPRKFWFIRWGTKAVRQEVTTRNPYSRITYTEYIELKRRKRK